MQMNIDNDLERWIEEIQKKLYPLEYDEYYCENCFKKISKKEYELNDNMREESYSEYLMLHINE